MRIVAFEPETDLIYVADERLGVRELSIEKKREEFDIIAHNVANVLVRCLHFDGQLNLLGFYLDLSKTV